MKKAFVISLVLILLLCVLSIGIGIGLKAIAQEETPTPTPTSCAMPSKPQVPFPANGSPNTVTNPLLSWNASTNAIYYEVYWGPSQSMENYRKTYNTSYQLSSLNVSTKYYWQIVANNICGLFSESDLWTFTTGCPVPAKPQNPNPMSGSDQIAIYETYLSWNASSGATSYDVYFGTSTTPSLYGNTSNINYQLPQLNQSTKYYWRVVANNSCGTNSSDPWNFTTGCDVVVKPRTPSPASGSIDTVINPMLSWNASANASYYEIYLGTSASPEYYDSTDNNNYQLPRLDTNTKYYWMIRAKSVCDIADSDVWNFTTGCPVAKPQSPSPVNGSDQVSIDAHLSWNTSANSSFYNAVFYDVYFGTSATPTLYGNTSNSNYDLPQLNYSTIYYWQIVSFNTSTCNASGPVWGFTTGDAPPYTPTPTTVPTPIPPHTSAPTPIPTEITPTSEKGETPVWLWAVLVLDAVLTMVMLGAIVIMANKRRRGQPEVSAKRKPSLFSFSRRRRSAPPPPKGK